MSCPPVFAEVKICGTVMAQFANVSVREHDSEYFVALESPAPTGSLIWAGAAESLQPFFVVRTIESAGGGEALLGNLIRPATAEQIAAAAGLPSAHL